MTIWYQTNPDGSIYYLDPNLQTYRWAESISEMNSQIQLSGITTKNIVDSLYINQGLPIPADAYTALVFPLGQPTGTEATTGASTGGGIGKGNGVGSGVLLLLGAVVLGFILFGGKKR